MRYSFKKIFISVLATVSLVILFPCVTAGSLSKTSDSLVAELSKQPSYSSKVRLLHNLMDITSDTAHYIKYNRLLWNISSERKDEITELEAIRNLMNIDKSDTIARYIVHAEKLPSSNAQKEVVTYLKYVYTIKTFDYKSDREKSEMLCNLIESAKKINIDDADFISSNKKGKIYESVGMLFNLCAALSYVTTDSLYADYIGDLGKLINKLPSDGREVLPGVYYVLAANFYSRKGMLEKSYNADLKLIEIGSKLENKYKKEGRKFRKLDSYYYVSYRRMLMDTTVLSKAEIEALFVKIKALADGNPKIAEDFDAPYSISYIRYYMATKQYEKAIPYLDAALNSKSKSEKWMWQECLRDRVLAGRSIPNDPDLLKYTLEYLDAVKAERSESVKEKTKELQVLYDVNKLKIDNARSDLRFSRMVIIVAIAFLVILTILLIVAIKVLAKTRILKNKAESANKLKSVFLQNMSHEIRTPLNAIVGFSDMLADENSDLEKAEKTQFSKLIKENTEILLTKINDVMDIAMMESGDIQITNSECSLNWLCDYCISSARKHPQYANSCTVMSFLPHNDDIVIQTDKQKIVRLLDNFLTNAAKFTKQGSIILDYEMLIGGCEGYKLPSERKVNRKAKTQEVSINSVLKGADKGLILFSVTDTGVGVPQDKSDAIFERFEKLDTFEQGTGLGLHICRLIAHALGGEVYLDTSYHGGSRFLFALPLKQI
ncbi:MAG: ATP-binding protein [Bacteroidales bacterium]|jgi:signal transduction histidine kinase|nr:ATP-binding protein [Bacteroidales bacterium]